MTGQPFYRYLNADKPPPLPLEFNQLTSPALSLLEPWGDSAVAGACHQAALWAAANPD